LTITGLRNESDGIEVYPNPTSEYIRLRVPGPSAGSITLTDVIGKIYMEKTIDQPESFLSTQFVPNGVYILQINLITVKAIRKIIVLH
jgi:hypothetical protein